MLNQALGNKLHTQRGWKAGLWHRQLFSAEAYPPPAGPATRTCLWQCCMEGAEAKHKDSFSTWCCVCWQTCVCVFPGFPLRNVQHDAACWRLGSGWKQSRLAQGRAGTFLPLGKPRCSWKDEIWILGAASLEVKAGRAKPETAFSLLANKISSNPQLFTPTVIPPKVLASLVQFSFNSCVCICK